MSSGSVLPTRMVVPTHEEEFFWRSGADGRLRFLHCEACDRFHHPPAPRCPFCDGPVEPRPVGGRARLAAWTVNHQPWLPGFEPPYVVAMVEIDEDPTIRLTTNLVDVDPASADEDLTVGQPVEVVFEPSGDWFVPLFRPI